MVDNGKEAERLRSVRDWSHPVYCPENRAGVGLQSAGRIKEEDGFTKTGTDSARVESHFGGP